MYYSNSRLTHWNEYRQANREWVREMGKLEIWDWWMNRVGEEEGERKGRERETERKIIWLGALPIWSDRYFTYSLFQPFRKLPETPWK